MKIEMQGITKLFPNGVLANDEVDFSVEKGEIHALIGENGAGKTTLMNILYGLYQPTSGKIKIDGVEKEFHSAREAINEGVGMIHQHFMLVPIFTVAQNIVLGFEPQQKGLLDEKKAQEISLELSKQFSLSIDPNSVIRDLSVGMQQRVEILKLLYQGADILIFDEPTAVLTPQETRDLFTSVRSLVEMGKTVIFITHKLKEVQEISQRFTVMRRGKRIAARDTQGVSREEMANLMVGREVFLQTKKEPPKVKDVVLEVEALNSRAEPGKQELKDISFNIRSGEILGIAAVEGNGQSELVEIITGLRAASSGSVKVHGEEIIGLSPKEVKIVGVGHIPEDRSYNGYASEVTIEENLIIDRYWKKPYSKYYFINKRVVEENAKALIEQFDIRVQSGKQPTGQGSGGNIQKVIVARELTSSSKLLLASQPTRGVDVGAAEYIRDLIVKQRTEGQAVLLTSADLGEVLNLSDRIVTMYEGEITGIFNNNPPLQEEEVGHYMLGKKQQSREEYVHEQ